MAAATALLEWQPLFHLEKENYQLREENRHLAFQVQELLQWKEKAIKQMIALGPTRARAQREVQHATRLKQRLQAVEQSLQTRAILEQTNNALQDRELQLVERLGALETECTTLTAAVDDLRAREATATAHLERLGDSFRVHLEQLVAIRERIDGDGASNHEAGAEGNDAETKDGAPRQPTEAATPPPATSSVVDDAPTTTAEVTTITDPAELITGLEAVSAKCLRWFQQHVAETFAQIQDKAALYESQHLELESLRVRVQSIRSDVEVSVAKDQQQTRALARLERVNGELEDAVARLRREAETQRQGQTALRDHVRLVVTEVRQYLRVVRAEIKRKFGYVPEAIAHAEHWSRILAALDVLERHLRIAAAHPSSG